MKNNHVSWVVYASRIYYPGYEVIVTCQRVYRKSPLVLTLTRNLHKRLITARFEKYLWPGPFGTRPFKCWLIQVQSALLHCAAAAPRGSRSAVLPNFHEKLISTGTVAQIIHKTDSHMDQYHSLLLFPPSSITMALDSALFTVSKDSQSFRPTAKEAISFSDRLLEIDTSPCRPNAHSAVFCSIHRPSMSQWKLCGTYNRRAIGIFRWITTYTEGYIHHRNSIMP